MLFWSDRPSLLVISTEHSAQNGTLQQAGGEMGAPNYKRSTGFRSSLKFEFFNKIKLSEYWVLYFLPF